MGMPWYIHGSWDVARWMLNSVTRVKQRKKRLEDEPGKRKLVSDCFCYWIWCPDKEFELSLTHDGANTKDFQ